MSVLQLRQKWASRKKVHIIPSCLLKTRQLLKVCVEHSTHRWERWDQVVKFPPYKGPWQKTVSSSSLNTVALMQLDWVWFCNSVSQNDIIRFHSINLTSNSSRVRYPSRWRSPKNMIKWQKMALFLHRDKVSNFQGELQHFFMFSLTPFSSRAASGLLMLLTNLLTCSKCLVISVASTISMIACRSVRYSFLGRRRSGGT